MINGVLIRMEIATTKFFFLYDCYEHNIRLLNLSCVNVERSHYHVFSFRTVENDRSPDLLVANSGALAREVRQRNTMGKKFCKPQIQPIKFSCHVSIRASERSPVRSS